MDSVGLFRCPRTARYRYPLVALAFCRRHFASLQLLLLCCLSIGAPDSQVSARKPTHWRNCWICRKQTVSDHCHLSQCLGFLVLQIDISASLWQCSHSCHEDGWFPRSLRNSPRWLGSLDHQWCTDLYQLSPKIGLKFHGSLVTLSAASLRICCRSHIERCTPSVQQSYLASTYSLWLFSSNRSHLCVSCVAVLSSLVVSV